MPDLSVIIPSHDDIYLHRTIESVLQNAEVDVEVIPVLDGYTPKQPLSDDPRIKPIYAPVNEGMRASINKGVQAAKSPHIMRTDEHCMFGPGFGRIALASIEPNWIVTLRRYFLDPIKWEVMEDRGFIDYEKLEIITKPSGRMKFSGVLWRARSRERKDIPIDETMMMQGSMWVMARSWWDEVIGELQTEGYGTLYQDTTEMVFKTWRAGGKLMVNKLTWFAHKHRDFNRTHDYPGDLADASFRHALSVWRDDYERVRAKWGI